MLTRIASPLGTILLVTDGAAVVALDFADCEARMQRLLHRHGGGSGPLPSDDAAGEVGQHLQRYFAGEIDALDAIPVEAGGSPFQRRVWAALRKIPAGTTTSYGRIAASIGAPGASRAVGLANGGNPVALIVPCHRVVGADGTLTGYGGGLARKAWLLRHEAAHAPALDICLRATA